METFIETSEMNKSQYLNVKSPNAADKLTGVISTAVLENIGGADGSSLVEQYTKRYGGFA